jgi:hypothetical protein
LIHARDASQVRRAIIVTPQDAQEGMNPGNVEDCQQWAAAKSKAFDGPPTLKVQVITTHLGKGCWASTVIFKDGVSFVARWFALVPLTPGKVLDVSCHSLDGPDDMYRPCLKALDSLSLIDTGRKRARP